MGHWQQTALLGHARRLPCPARLDAQGIAALGVVDAEQACHVPEGRMTHDGPSSIISEQPGKAACHRILRNSRGCTVVEEVARSSRPLGSACRSSCRSWRQISWGQVGFALSANKMIAVDLIPFFRVPASPEVSLVTAVAVDELGFDLFMAVGAVGQHCRDRHDSNVLMSI